MREFQINWENWTYEISEKINRENRRELRENTREIKLNLSKFEDSQLSTINCRNPPSWFESHPAAIERKISTFISRKELKSLSWENVIYRPLCIFDKRKTTAHWVRVVLWPYLSYNFIYFLLQYSIFIFASFFPFQFYIYLIFFTFFFLCLHKNSKTLRGIDP